MTTPWRRRRSATTRALGDGADMARRGVISMSTRRLRVLGCAPGQLAWRRRSADGGALPTSRPPVLAETRHLLLDTSESKSGRSIRPSLVRRRMPGRFVLVGSHGGGPPASGR